METAVNARVRRPHAGDIVVGNVLHDFEGGFGWEEEYFDADTISRYDHRLDMYQGPAVCCHSDHLYCVSLPPHISEFIGDPTFTSSVIRSRYMSVQHASDQ